MSAENHLNALRTKHENLDHQISELEASPSVDSLEIAALKKKKLLLKEEIETLATVH